MDAFVLQTTLAFRGHVQGVRVAAVQPFQGLPRVDVHRPTFDGATFFKDEAAWEGVQLYQSSKFCLSPPAKTGYDMHLYTHMLAGCVPVVTGE